MRHTRQTPRSNRFRRGFTIVELLIVIVVIGILATITLVAYNGVQQKAAAVVLKSDLKQAQTQLELDRMNDGAYPNSKEAANGGDGLRASPDTNLDYTKSGTDYCLTASSDRAKTSFHITSNGTIQDGACGDGASTKALTFDGNGSTGGSTATQSIASNATAALTTNGFARSGYSFGSWNTATDGSGTSYADGANYTMGASNASLYAQWTVNVYTLSFNSAGGTAVTAITQDYGTAITPPASPTKAGYSFSNWSPALPSTMPAADQTVTAQWTANTYTITFDSNGGKGGSAAAQSLATDATAPLEGNGFTYGDDQYSNCYTPSYWMTDPVYEEGTDIYQLGADYTMGTSDVTLYAKWEIYEICD
jgi:prepilin-type N-terminal cleavage/methylation domain-containing protein